MIEGDAVNIKELLPKHQNPNKLPYLEYYEDYMGKVGLVMYVSMGYENPIAIVKFKDGKELCFDQSELEMSNLVDFYGEWK